MPNSSCIAKCDSHHFQYPGYHCRLVIMGKKKESGSLLLDRHTSTQSRVKRVSFSVPKLLGKSRLGCLWAALCQGEWDTLWQCVGQPTACGSTTGRRMCGSRAGTVGKIGQKHLRPQQGTSAGAEELVLGREC